MLIFGLSFGLGTSNVWAATANDGGSLVTMQQQSSLSIVTAASGGDTTMDFADEASGTDSDTITLNATIVGNAVVVGALSNFVTGAIDAAISFIDIKIDPNSAGLTENGGSGGLDATDLSDSSGAFTTLTTSPTNLVAKAVVAAGAKQTIDATIPFSVKGTLTSAQPAFSGETATITLTVNDA